MILIKNYKINIDYIPNYNKNMFLNDINRYIIRNHNLTRKIRHFVDDNYLMHLTNNNYKTPNLQFNNSHAKVLYEISLLTNMYIPLASFAPVFLALTNPSFFLCTTIILLSLSAYSSAI